MENPYTPPKSELLGASQTQSRTQKKLYSVGGVGIATFFGSILAGAVIMAINFYRLERPDRANLTLIVGLIATAGIIGISMILPENFPGILLTMAQLLAMIQITKSLQGVALMEHLSYGGKLESNWKAFGISLLVIIPIAGILLLIIL